MHTGLLKSWFIYFLSFLLSVTVQAQQVRFIYIQTENKEPFYVKIDNRVFTSSESGYLIISRLIENEYKLVIGFPENEWPELNVTVNVKDTNAGFMLKNYGKGGWGMINMQSMEFLVMQKSSALLKEMETKTSDNEFARVLAAVVNDPSIAEVTIAKKITEAVNTTTENKPVVIPAAKETVQPKVAKLMQDSTSEGLLITYLDSVTAGADTVKVFLPVNKTVLPGTVSEKGIIDSNDPRFINMELQNPNAKTDSGTVAKDDFVITEKKGKKATELNSNKGTINADCKKMATQNDFLKLRKQMAGEASGKKMIKAANKQFSTTCYTTEQIKNLGVLFITEEEKYTFYVAAFASVTDKDNYGVLEDQFTDKYYKTRFSAMLSY